MVLRDRLHTGVPREILRFQPGHHIALYDRGRDAIDAMLDAIDGAEHHIHLETYILRADATGKQVLARLEQRARDGISVRLIFDAIGSRGLDRQQLAKLVAAGGEISVFNPPSRWLWRFHPRQRDHRKMLVVDGLIGFLGGLNLADEYVDRDASGAIWHDAHLRIEGPALTELEALFIENWFRCGGESFEWRHLIARQFDATGDLPVAILADGPTYRRRRLRSFFLDELERAQTRVLLVSPYFAPGPRVLTALEEASERGVHVELLLAGHSDHPLLRRAARAFVPRLSEAGIRIFEDDDRMMHAKLAVFDDSLAVIGTSNLDRQSLDHSCEVNAVCQGPEVAKWILDHFRTSRDGITAVDPDALSARPFADRWLDRVAAFWARI